MDSSTDLSWHVLRSHDEFLALQAEWERLFSANPNHSPFMAWGWVATWLKHLAGPHELSILALIDGHERLYAIVPLIKRRTSGVFQNTVLAIAGGYGPECSDHLGVLCTPDLENQIIERVTDGIRSELRTDCKIQLTSLASTYEVPRQLQAAFRLHGRRTLLRTQDACPVIELPSSWDEFLAQLSRNFRSQIKRQYKRILESDDLSFRTVNADDAEQFAEKLADLNRHRMRDKEKTSSAEDPRFRRFLVEVIPYMAGKGIAQMDILEQQGKAVGAALNFTHGETIYYYMGGFDKSITKLGPGNAIFSHVIQRGIENGFTKYDFLRGDEPYKYRWGAIDTPIQSLTIYPANRIRGNIAYAMDVISEGPVKIS